jgi:hypothetical protein
MNTGERWAEAGEPNRTSGAVRAPHVRTAYFGED